MAYTWDKANAKAKSKRETQYFEMFGNRAIYHDGWMAATPPPQPPWLMGTAAMPEVLNGYKWELYNIAEDYSQNNDLAAKNPEKLKELQELFLVEAKKYQVFPLDNSILERLLTPRPSSTAGRTEFTYSGEMSGLPDGSVPNTLAKSYSITAEVEIPAGRRRGHAQHARRPLRRLRPLPAEGQAGVHLQPPGGGEIPLGRQGSARAGQTHHRV